ncbi:type IV pilus modification PilV family protein [Botrimarina hoheduenensis]|uniref:Uncharacterized protein n=1 Tax=Botrimarina hoheduenensis TaxID=2528000 RepID=A0A5C5W9W1_9BACT|nr:hypothetical protein [Botrimarina hoheduenensis]TWT46819.1 hypothetical protein Pla111_19210 [Botrimarina hoheduenensis]
MVFIPVHTADRGGLTLAEVLVSMGILAVGLLGVAALFPVGGHYMQTGDVTDHSGAVAQAALSDAIIRGDLNPSNWVTHNISRANNQHRFTNFVTGTIQTTGGSVSAGIGALEALSRTQTSQYQLFGQTANRPSAASYRGSLLGEAFVIDPIGLTGVLADETSNASIVQTSQSSAVNRFPATALQLDYQSPYWIPWNHSNVTWPIRRVTTVNSTLALASLAFAYQLPLAEAYFSAADDPAQQLPEDLDKPAEMRWDRPSGATPTSVPLGRQTRGDYSWLISVVPGSGEARDALATRPDAYQYDVSAVVFHKRVAGLGLNGTLETERLVRAKVVSTGTAGGELLLEKRPDSVDRDAASPAEVLDTPFKDLRKGQYVMLVGPHPSTTVERPMLFAQWYRVLTIDASGTPQLPGGQTLPPAQRKLDEDNRVLVGLRGPDWPWQPSGDLSTANALPNDLRVVIVPGIVAVHTKTMRLEAGSAWGFN